MDTPLKLSQTELNKTSVTKPIPKKRKNQLFRKIPEMGIINKVLNCFGLQNIEDTTIFSRNDLINRQTIQQILQIKTDLEEYYLPCKARTYLNQLTEKNVITVLRQLIKYYGYKVYSKEKYMKGDRYITYQIQAVHVPQTSINSPSQPMMKKKCTVNFD